MKEQDSQTPKASRSGAAAEGSQSPSQPCSDYPECADKGCPACAHPVAEGRQSPGRRDIAEHTTNGWPDNLAPVPSHPPVPAGLAAADIEAVDKAMAGWKRHLGGGNLFSVGAWERIKAALAATPSQEEGPASLHLEADSLIRANIGFLTAEAYTIGLPATKRHWLWAARDYAKKRGWPVEKPSHDTAVIENESAKPLQEEGPAGVDLDGLPLGRLMSAITQARRDGNWSVVDAIGEEWRQARRLRAQAPASSPRDLEAVQKALAIGWRFAQGLSGDRKEAKDALWDASERIAVMLAHPPKGETPSEAADLENYRSTMWYARTFITPDALGKPVIDALEKHCEEIDTVIKSMAGTPIEAADLEAGESKPDGFPPAIYLDKTTRRWYLPGESNEHGPIENAGCRYGVTIDAPGTAIEKAAREYVEAQRALISARGTRDLMVWEEAADAAWTDLCVAVDGWKPDARASLSSLPQEADDRSPAILTVEILGSGSTCNSRGAPKWAWKNVAHLAKCMLAEGAQEPKEGGAA